MLQHWKGCLFYTVWRDVFNIVKDERWSPTTCVCLIVCDLETSKQGTLSPIWTVEPQKKMSVVD
jgi:hypothetical protein